MQGSLENVKKVCMIGAGGSGKTSLVQRYLTQTFSEPYLLTIGSQFSTKLVTVKDPQGQDVVIKLIIWDLAGQERFDFIRTAYYRGSVGALLVYDVTRRSTWLELPKWLEETDSALGRRIPIILLANKVDLVNERVITTEAGQKFAQENGLIAYLETSALTGQNVEEAFNILARATLGFPISTS
ncbi:MAG: Rab family GTPase [Candidatus Thorarchaeota archaeon]